MMYLNKPQLNRRQLVGDEPRNLSSGCHRDAGTQPGSDGRDDEAGQAEDLFQGGGFLRVEEVVRRQGLCRREAPTPVCDVIILEHLSCYCKCKKFFIYIFFLHLLKMCTF